MEKYELEECIGAGASGEVFSVQDKTSKIRFAMKKIPMPGNVVPPSVFREASIMFEAQCSGIVKLEEVFFEDSCLCFIMELLSTNLTRHLVFSAEVYSDLTVIKKLMKQMFSALKYCHSRGVVHRDLKPDNLLLDTTVESKLVIKIGDFGLSRFWFGLDDGLTPKVGTLGYQAPEVLLGSTSYSDKVDVWAMGCILVQMVKASIEPLFAGDEEMTVLDQIFRKLGTPNEDSWPGVSCLTGYDFSLTSYPGMDLGDIVPSLSEEGRDFLSTLLILDPSQRISANDALRHPFLSIED